MSSESQWLTVKEYAVYFRVTERTVRQWIKDRKVEAQRFGERGNWRIKVARAS